MTDLTITLQSESVILLPERALFQPRTGTLFIADLHLGKVETFQAYHLPLPSGSMAADLTRLSGVLTRIQAKRLVILGDLLHASRGREAALLAAFRVWRQFHQPLEITLVRGNHDKGAGDPPSDWQIECLNPPVVESPFVWAHFPEASPSGYVLSGHLHPAVQLFGKGKQKLKLPCFWFSQHVGVLPAFTSLTASAPISPLPQDQVFIIANNEIYRR